MLTVKRHVQPSGATNDAVFLHGNSHPLARILPYIYQDYVPDMETDIRRTRLLQGKNEKALRGDTGNSVTAYYCLSAQYNDGTKNYCSVEIKTEPTLQRRTTQHSSGIGNHATGRQGQGIDTIGRLNSFHRLPLTGVIGDIAL